MNCRGAACTGLNWSNMIDVDLWARRLYAGGAEDARTPALQAVLEVFEGRGVLGSVTRTDGEGLGGRDDDWAMSSGGHASSWGIVRALTMAAGGEVRADSKSPWRRRLTFRRRRAPLPVQSQESL